MIRLSRPWNDQPIEDNKPFEPEDCLLTEIQGTPMARLVHTELMSIARGDSRSALLLHPYPKWSRASDPTRENFPVRRGRGQIHREENPEDAEIDAAEYRMNEVMARVLELEEALDDPANVWSRLRTAWKRAADESRPRMAEIVRQSRELPNRLRDLDTRIRRVLRRSREQVPLNRVQEMDRASMRWLVRQPGRTVAERAGSSQRILATVRSENFDTLENRVLRAYTRLAAEVARDWLAEHQKARGSDRYSMVEQHRKRCTRFDRQLYEHRVRLATPGLTNFVLMNDPAYRDVHHAWIRLLKRRKAEDDLWAWQAQTWTDFCVLAIVLALEELEDSELIAQSPIVWRNEAVQGRWFEQDCPLAVFWLRKARRIVEIQARPEAPGAPLFFARAHVALRIINSEIPHVERKVAVWTPHALRRIETTEAAAGTCRRLKALQQHCRQEYLRDGLVLLPAHGEATIENIVSDTIRSTVIALDGSGASLATGLAALQIFLKPDIYREAV